MAVMGKSSSSITGGVMFFLLAITLFGGTNALGFDTVGDYYNDVVNDINDLNNQIHDTFYPNDNPLMRWGTGVFIAIIVGIVVTAVLIITCCCCMCYHCCCKNSPPPYTTLVVAQNQPHPMGQPNHGAQMNMQPAPFAHQQPYVIKQ